MVSLKIRLDIFTVEILLKAVDKQASLVSTVPLVECDQEILEQFMLKNPVWDLHGVSREDYLAKSKAERAQLILTDYNSMVNGGQLHFIDFFEGAFNFFKFFCSKFAK